MRISIKDVSDGAQAARQLALGHVDLAVIKVVQETPGVLRSVAILRRRAILVRARTEAATDDEDVHYVEAALAKAGRPSSIGLQDIVDAKPLKAGSKGLTNATELRTDLPFLIAATVPGPGGEDLETLALTYQLVARFDAAKSDIADVSRWVENGRAALTNGQPATLTLPMTDEDQGLRAHDGVYSFRSREESTFPERNSDFLYLLVAAIGGAASVFGALWANFRSQLRDGGERYLGRLEVLTKELHDADDLDRIDRVAHTGLQLAQRFGREIAGHKIERRVEVSFQMLYAAFREEATRKIERLGKLDRSTSPQRVD
jgi:hypothetical protein